MTLIELWRFVVEGGPLAMLALIIYAGYKEWYVWRGPYRRLEAERDAWKRECEKWQHIALRSTGVNEKIIRLADTATTLGEQHP